jgi:dTDP-4-amino-4,6-dideoxygalactose transaminase
LLAEENDLQLPARAEGCEPVCWMYGVILKNSFGCTKQEVRDHLEQDGVETRSFFIPMKQQPVFQGKNSRWPELSGKYTVSERLGEHGLICPAAGAVREDQEYVVERLMACENKDGAKGSRVKDQGLKQHAARVGDSDVLPGISQGHLSC